MLGNNRTCVRLTLALSSLTETVSESANAAATPFSTCSGTCNTRPVLQTLIAVEISVQ